jgi:hypothetical protein
VPLPGTTVLVSIFILIYLLDLKNSCCRIDMVCTPIYHFSALEGKYLEPATSSHPIEAKGYEIHPDFTSLVREMNFPGGLDVNPYKHLVTPENVTWWWMA